mgnify:CR=1 FL=1
MKTLSPATNVTVTQTLRDSDIMPTQQRLRIARFLFAAPQHLSADQIFERVNLNGDQVSQATVYNTLRLFVEKGLLNQVIIDPNKIFYDTNLSKHHHLYHVDDGILEDIPNNQIEIKNLPELPADTLFDGINIVVRVRRQ